MAGTPGSGEIRRRIWSACLAIPREGRLEHVQGASFARWLAPGGAWSSTRSRTNIVPSKRGFRTFLRIFNVRRYRHGRRPGKLLIKPSSEAIEAYPQNGWPRRCAGCAAPTPGRWIARIEPNYPGGGPPYYRGAVVQQGFFSSLDHYMWQLTSGWARRTHSERSRKKWIARRYWGPVQQFRNDQWGVRADPDRSLGDRREKHPRGLVKFAWTPIVRHTRWSRGPASPRPTPVT